MSEKPRYWPNEHVCPDGELHIWSVERVFVVDAGPMEGDWFVTSCERCNSGMIRPIDGGSGIENFLAELERAGCDPRPVDGV